MQAMTIPIGLSLALTLVLAGCSDGAADSPLAYAPADSAFVFGNLSAPPKEYAQLNLRWNAYTNPGMVQSLQRFQDISAEIFGQTESQQQANALAQVLAHQLNQAEGWASIGVDINAKMAFYEVNALPVLRIELADKARFEAFIKAAEDTAGIPLGRTELAGQAFWHSAHSSSANAGSSPRLVAAIVGKHLVLTIDSQHANAPLLAQLGIHKPKPSVIDTGSLKALNAQYGFQSGAASGYIDFQRIVALATAAEQTPPWIASVLNNAGYSLDASCQTELGSMAAKAPRIVAGATQLPRPELTLNIIWELAPDLAQEFRALPAPVQGLEGRSQDSVVFGSSLNLSAAASLLQKQAASITARPYQCALLQPLNRIAAKANTLLTPLHLSSNWFQGFRADITSFNPKDQSMTGTLLIATPNPSGLVGMVHSLMPGLTPPDLVAGGSAKPLALPDSAPFSSWGQSAWAIVGKNSVGLAIGANEKALLEQAIQTPIPAVPPLAYYSASGKTIAEQTRAMLDTEPQWLTNSPWERWLNDLSWPISVSSMALYQEIEYEHMQWLATERGLEFPLTMVFKPQQTKTP